MSNIKEKKFSSHIIKDRGEVRKALGLPLFHFSHTGAFEICRGNYSIDARRFFKDKNKLVIMDGFKKILNSTVSRASNRILIPRTKIVSSDIFLLPGSGTWLVDSHEVRSALPGTRLPFGNVKGTLGLVAVLLVLQQDGQEGRLLTNGHANVFDVYIGKKNRREIYSIIIDRATETQWCLDAQSSHSFISGDRIFSRFSSESEE